MKCKLEMISIVLPTWCLAQQFSHPYPGFWLLPWLICYEKETQQSLRQQMSEEQTWICVICFVFAINHILTPPSQKAREDNL